MSERLPDIEQPPMTPAQESRLRLLCERYEVDFDPSHYYVSPADSYIMPGWAEGWIGGPEHARDEYRHSSLPVAKPTIYVGVSPQGEVHS
jgi:hypothetical protein